MSINHTTPVGRIVQGNLYKPNDKDAEGKPLVTKSGPNTGQPRVDFYFAIAIAKGRETHWSQTDWGQKILQVGATAFPQAYQSPLFAWKIKDGDSAVPNKKGKVPNKTEGFPGHWILSFSSGFAPKIYRTHEGSQVPYMDHDAVKPGHYVQVNFNCDGNGSQSQPGVYLNHSMVSFSGFGPEIVFGPDANAAGFGNAAAPAGMTLAPVGGFNPAIVPGAPGLPGAAPAVLGLPAMALSAAAAAPLLPGFAGAPALPGLPAMAAPLAVAPQMPALPQLAPVAGAPYSIEQCRAQGWTDAQIVQAGYGVMTAPAAAPVPMGLAPLPPAFSAPVAPAAVAMAAPVPVTPNPQFVQMMPGAPAGGQLVMNPGAPGTYEQFKAQNWSDDQIIAGGHARRA